MLEFNDGCKVPCRINAEATATLRMAVALSSELRCCAAQMSRPCWSGEGKPFTPGFEFDHVLIQHVAGGFRHFGKWHPHGGAI